MNRLKISGEKYGHSCTILKYQFDVLLLEYFHFRNKIKISIGIYNEIKKNVSLLTVL